MGALTTLETLLPAMDAMGDEPPRPLHIRGLGDVLIRELRIGEVDEQIADTSDPKNKQGVARGACRLLAKENGQPVLDARNPEHVAKMAKLPLRVLTAINKAGEVDDDGKADAAGN